jgi:hypothetical protein
MNSLRKILACVVAVATLSTVASVGTFAEDTATIGDSSAGYQYVGAMDNWEHTYYLSSDGSTIKGIYLTNGEPTGEETQLTTADGETVTLSQYAYALTDLDGNVYAYCDSVGIDTSPAYVYSYYLADGKKIEGFPIFDLDGNYVGCVDDTFGTSFTLEDGTVITATSALDNSKAHVSSSIFYDADGNYDGYQVSTLVYSYDTTADELFTLPTGEQVEKVTNAINVRFDKDGNYVGFAFSSLISEPVQNPTTEPDETTLQRGDVNGDGTINALDLLQLKKYILGIVDSLE